MDSIIQFLKEKKSPNGEKYRVIDITKSVTNFDQHIKYNEIISKKDNVIAFYRKTKNNTDLFHPYILDCPSKDMNILFLFKGKYFALTEPKKFTTKLIRIFNKFLDDDTLYCGICMEQNDDVNLCSICSYVICYKCCKKIDESTTEMMKCPHCRNAFNLNYSPKNGKLQGIITKEEAKKYGIEKGGSVYTKDGSKLLFVTEEEMKKMNLI
jgi:hypothetical protein